MSAIATIYHPQKIFIAADSLLQTTSNYATKEITGTTLCQKLFFVPKVATVFAACGHSTCNGKGIRKIVQEVLEKFPALTTHPAFVSEFCAHVLREYPSMETEFHFSGFHEGKAHVFDFDRSKEKNAAPIRKNLNSKGEPTACILGCCDPSTIRWVQCVKPDFWKMTDQQILDFLNEFFRREVELAQKKKVPDVGYPIDVVRLDSTGHQFIQIRDREAAIVS